VFFHAHDLHWSRGDYLQLFSLLTTARSQFAPLLRTGALCFAGLLAGNVDAKTDWRRLENPEIGFSLRYPSNWRVTGAVIASEFAAASASRCQSVQIVDTSIQPDSGQSAQVRQSFVQVCGQPLVDDKSLDTYMEEVYGVSLAAQFQHTEFACLHAFEAADAGQRIIFLQTSTQRVQIIAVVVATRGKESERRYQVGLILESLDFRAPDMCEG
jgi:hypothetical protein